LEVKKMEKHNILICDDEEGVRESLDLILSNRYNLSFAKDGKQAISMLSDPPNTDLLLLDIKMPEKNGFDTLKELRASGNNTPVIIITGYQSVETATEAVKLGAANYIIKPFETETVLDSIEKALS